MRQANQTDLEQIAALENACFPPEQAADRESFARQLEVFPNHFLLFFADNGDCVGMINGAVNEKRYIRDEMYADTGYHRESGAFQAVYSLVVQPEYQHQGYAHQLMAAMVEQARKEGRNGVILTCRPGKSVFMSPWVFAKRAWRILTTVM